VAREIVAEAPVVEEVEREIVVKRAVPGGGLATSERWSVEDYSNIDEVLAECCLLPLQKPRCLVFDKTFAGAISLLMNVKGRLLTQLTRKICGEEKQNHWHADSKFPKFLLVALETFLIASSCGTIPTTYI